MPTPNGDTVSPWAKPTAAYARPPARSAVMAPFASNPAVSPGASSTGLPSHAGW